MFVKVYISLKVTYEAEECDFRVKKKYQKIVAKLLKDQHERSLVSLQPAALNLHCSGGKRDGVFMGS